MSEQQNIDTVPSMYAAFGRGDIPFIFDQLAPGAKWISNPDPIVPWGGDFTGHPQDFSRPSPIRWTSSASSRPNSSPRTIR
ncbi:MAG TPA: hypothetical protein VHE55_08985 [Fimbriimonadaceae bacterium]|nr:hypothetical protein [Fimbriimonadaceae bacterium]